VKSKKCPTFPMLMGALGALGVVTSTGCLKPGELKSSAVSWWDWDRTTLPVDQVFQDQNTHAPLKVLFVGQSFTSTPITLNLQRVTESVMFSCTYEKILSPRESPSICQTSLLTPTSESNFPFLNPKTGQLSWKPTPLAVGTYRILLRAQALGVTREHEFFLNVVEEPTLTGFSTDLAFLYDSSFVTHELEGISIPRISGPAFPNLWFHNPPTFISWRNLMGGATSIEIQRSRWRGSGTPASPFCAAIDTTDPYHSGININLLDSRMERSRHLSNAPNGEGFVYEIWFKLENGATTFRPFHLVGDGTGSASADDARKGYSVKVSGTGTESSLTHKFELELRYQTDLSGTAPQDLVYSRPSSRSFPEVKSGWQHLAFFGFPYRSDLDTHFLMGLQLNGAAVALTSGELPGDCGGLMNGDLGLATFTKNSPSCTWSPPSSVVPLRLLPPDSGSVSVGLLRGSRIPGPHPTGSTGLDSKLTTVRADIKKRFCSTYQRYGISRPAICTPS
jgi:hypothetical protein